MLSEIIVRPRTMMQSKNPYSLNEHNPIKAFSDEQ